MIQDVLDELSQSVDYDDRYTESDDSSHIKTCDAETNTEGEYSHVEIKRRSHSSVRNSTIRRSQTFSPACHHGAGYVCKVSWPHPPAAGLHRSGTRGAHQPVGTGFWCLRNVLPENTSWCLCALDWEGTKKEEFIVCFSV